MPYDKQGNWYEVDPDTGMAGAAPRPQIAPAQLQDWYSALGLMFPRFNVGDLSWSAPYQNPSGEADPYNSGGNINLANAGNYGHFANLIGPMAGNSSYQISGGGSNGAWSDPFAGNSFGLQMKSGDNAGTYITYNRQGDSWVPDVNSAGSRQWDTNAGIMQYAPLLAAGGLAAAPYISGLLGGGTAGVGGAAAPAGGSWGLVDTGALSGAGAAAPAAGGSWGLVDQGALAGTGGGTGLTATGAPGTLGAGSYSGAGGMVPGATSQLPSWLSGASKVAGALGGGSGLGGLIGAGLGYLDARNQPDNITIRNEIDPRLAEAAYGAGGVWPAAQGLLQQQLGQPNPLTQAGQQISSMANTTPNWNQLVTDAKGQWDANPFIQQQQQAITDLTTRNLRENVLPGIGTQAGYAGGFGGSRQGVAEALAMSRMNTDLAPALANLASNAWESGQNRVLSSASAAGNYGLNNQAQQANLLGQGANLQAMGPWNPINQAAGVMRGLPGNTSQVTPLFNNIYGNMLGGASLGSQIGSSVNWGDLFKGIGGLISGWGQ